jgi:hypothetical protein
MKTKLTFRFLLIIASMLVMALAFLLTFNFDVVEKNSNCFIGKSTVNNELVLMRTDCRKLHYR